MKFSRIVIALVLAAGCIAVGCKKDSLNIFNMFDIKLTLHESQAHAIGEYADVNPADSMLIDYTLESPTKDMYMVCILKTGATTPYIKIPIAEDGKRRSYSGRLTLYAKDLGAGTSSYRIWALDKEGVYLGDGYKTISINVLSDFRYLTNRKLFFPDATGTTGECYLSLNEGKTYSYEGGKTASAALDLGVYREPVFNPTTGLFTGFRYGLYSLSTTPLPFVGYDISSWTKRRTLFSAPVAGTAANFRTLFNTAAKIEAEAKKKPIDLTSITTGLAANQFIYFKTPEGKYGVLMVQSFNWDSMDRPFMTVSYKIQN